MKGAHLQRIHPIQIDNLKILSLRGVQHHLNALLALQGMS